MSLFNGVRVLVVAHIGSVRRELRGLGDLGALESLGSRRPPTVSPCSRVVAVAGCFEGVSGRGSMREVEDILLSERDDGSKGKVKTVLLMCSEPGAGRVARWYTKNCRFQQRYQEIGLFNNGNRGMVLVLGLIILTSIIY